MASDVDAGAAYVQWLGSSVYEGKDLSAIAKTDTRYLKPLDALSKLQLATGTLTEEEFKGFFDDFNATGFKSVQDYFDYQKQHGYDEVVFNNYNAIEKAFN